MGSFKMTKKKFKRIISYVLIMKCFFLVTCSALAQDLLPGSADPSRIKPLNNNEFIPEQLPSVLTPSSNASTVSIPEGAKNMTLHLNQVKLKGRTAFTEMELAYIYKPYLQKNISLDNIWKFANKITKHYQDAGYFLSRAYIPMQEIENGVVVIHIVEGYIAEVKLDKAFSERFQIKKLISRLKKNRPINAYNLESFMLQMNELPGQKFRSIVEPINNDNTGAVQLSLLPKAEGGHLSTQLNNYGSPFLGPYQASATYQDSFLPLQETTFSISASVPADELKSVAFNHAIPLYPDFKLALSGDYINSYPGDSLEVYDIESKSVDVGVKLSWQPIRQRLENLVTSLEISGKNTDSYILSNALLTEDRIRSARLKINYDVADKMNGYNYLSFTVNQGLNILNASEQGDSNLSRSEAVPDFTTFQFDYTRQQNLTRQLMVVTLLSGQIASGPLFSSEEFGYGGQKFGRAYNPSEITGDHGISGSLELLYFGINPWKQISFTPYTFYDLGKVFNEDSEGVNQSAASAGFGVDVKHSSGLSGEVGISWPLTLDASNPIYGDGNDPSFILQLSYQH